MKNYEVTIYFSSLCTMTIRAENEEQAIIKARELKPNADEIFSNLENWEEADEAFESEDGESK